MQPRDITLGTNRTGMKASPIDAGELMEAMELQDQLRNGSSEVGANVDADTMRSDYRAEAEPVGSVPPPTNLRGMFGTAAQALAGNKLHILLDKLGERAAFERTGVRLYEAAIVKLSGEVDLPKGMSLTALQEIRDDEASHFALVAEAIESLGGDPTTQTPCADVVGVQGLGLVQVMGDPRTTVPQALQALLSAELIDVASWELLIQLIESFGQDELAERFSAALATESRHEQLVRSWLSASLQDAAHVGSDRGERQQTKT
ncbi:MAG TPA: ferritin-like domain-containing protein [Lysobacter sp.]|nr:ferritin-like domain-containing protein [Lysobacter sp.]